MTAVAGRDMRVVVEPVRRVKPAIETAAERGLVAMGIPGVVEGAVQRGPLVGLAVAIGILEQPNVGNAPDERLPMGIVGAEGINSNGNIQAVGELGHLSSATVCTEILENHHPVPTDPVGRSGPGVLDARRDPKPACRIKGEVHGLVDVGLVRHQLDFESGRQSEGLRLIGRTHGLGLAHTQGQVGIIRAEQRICPETESRNGSGDETMESSRDFHDTTDGGTLSLRGRGINPRGDPEIRHGEPMEQEHLETGRLTPLPKQSQLDEGSSGQ